MKKERNGKEINDRINLLLFIIAIQFCFIIWLSILIII
jgi:hypothetical protein